VLYWKKENKYVSIKKFNPLTHTYTCRVIFPKDQNYGEKENNDEITEIE
jgi:hypothetical protein